MELLECDDFKPFFGKTTHRPHTTTHTKSKLVDISKNNNIVKSAKSTNPGVRRSIIDPPVDFRNTLNTEEFELIEKLIDQNYEEGYDVNKDLNDINFDIISNKIINSLFVQNEEVIDPRLINENDNLLIPDNLKMDDYSSHSSNDNVSTADLEKQPVTKVVKPLGQKKTIKTLNHNPRVAKSTNTIHKSTASLTSSPSTRSHISTPDKKKTLTSLKKTVPLVDAVKPKHLKSKQDVQNYFNQQERKNNVKIEKNNMEPLVSN